VFQGEVLTGSNGTFIANQYWVGNSAVAIGDMRVPGRFNVDLSLRRTFPIRERLKIRSLRMHPICSATLN
jgi:hypothetical protein